jgi:hypothetical protein
MLCPVRLITRSMRPVLLPRSLSTPISVRLDRSAPEAPCNSKNSQSVPDVLTWISLMNISGIPQVERLFRPGVPSGVEKL